MGSVNEYYEKYWDNPEEYNDPTTPVRQALLRSSLDKLPANSSVLDVGCGRGEFCAFFKTMGFRPAGIDISNQAIHFAQEKQPGIPFYAGEVQTLLPAHAEEFDCIFSSEVIEHLFDVTEFLQAVNRLLKPGGLFILTTPYHGLVKNIVLCLHGFASHFDPVGQHIRFFDQKSLAACLNNSGFKTHLWTGYGRVWPLWKSFFVASRKVTSI